MCSGRRFTWPSVLAMAWSPAQRCFPSVSLLIYACFVSLLHPIVSKGIHQVHRHPRENVRPKHPPPKRATPFLRPKRVVLHGDGFALGDRQLNEFPVWHAPIPTYGQVWPKPFYEDRKERVFHLKNATLKFKLARVSSDVLNKSLLRTHRIISERAVSVAPSTITALLPPTSRLRVLEKVIVTCYEVGGKWPHLEMDETYRLDVNPNGIHIWANEQWGALRGLETLTHLIWQNKDGEAFINEVTIRDKPAFPHRGMLVDTTRHYLSKNVILKNLEAMATNKLNVMHWHIVDDQSFPFQSQVYPELSGKGAYDPTEKVYTHNDVKEIIAHARSLGIRVIPEFDSPSHTYSWGRGHPELLTECFVNGLSDGFYGPLNLSKESTFTLLKNLFKEVALLFPDKFVHLGVDEVGNSCWLSNPDIQQMMNKMQLSSGSELSKYYIERLQSILTDIQNETKKKINSIVWQEARKSNARFTPGTLVQLWLANFDELTSVASTGQKVLYSSCWYLDNLKHWTAAYTCELGDAQASWRKNMLGGETCMWAERVNDFTMLTKSWPVASAPAERLWSFAADSLEVAGGRIEEQRCRMNLRGIPTGVPSGPGSCRVVRHGARRDITVRSSEQGPQFFIKTSLDIFSTSNNHIHNWLQFIIIVATVIAFFVFLKRRNLHIAMIRFLNHSFQKHRQFAALFAKWTAVLIVLLGITFLLV